MENFLLQLKALSSAEDFLTFFSIPYEEKVVNVNRLHILKRFFQYLRQQQLPGEHSEVLLFTTYRNLLSRAYQDFVTSTPAQEKVFKVFQDVDGRQHVSVDSLRASMSLRTAA